MRTALVALVALAALPLSSAAAEGSTGPPLFTVIVQVANPATALKRSQVADLFLKRSGRWPGGLAVVPVDQSAISAVRASFTKLVLGQSLSSVRRYWEEQAFTGGHTPPQVKASDEAVLAFVLANEGAVGYISAGDPLPRGVKALVLE